MIGDRLVIQEQHIRKAGLIMSTLLQNKAPFKCILAIGGESGTGKTEIASLLQEQLYVTKKIRTKIIHEDDYYLTNWINRNEVRKKKGIQSVGIKEINWFKINKVLKNFKEGKRKSYVQRIHKFTDSVEYVIINNSTIDVMIVEGLYTNHLIQKDVGIYLEGSIKDTYAFRKERFKENPDDAFRQQVLKQEAKDVRITKDKAHIWVSFKGVVRRQGVV